MVYRVQLKEVSAIDLERQTANCTFGIYEGDNLKPGDIVYAPTTIDGKPVYLQGVVSCV